MAIVCLTPPPYKVLGRVDFKTGIYELSEQGMELYETDERVQNIIIAQKRRFNCRLTFNNKDVTILRTHQQETVNEQH